MAMSFHSLNYPSHMVGCKSVQRSEVRTRRWQVLAMSPFSIMPKTEQSGNINNSRKSFPSDADCSGGEASGVSLLTQQNAVGIIGGVSVDSTLNFVKKLVKYGLKDRENGFPFVLCSDPLLSKEILSYERSSLPFLTGSGRSRQPKRDHSSIVDSLRRKRMFLERSGAQCIVMPCHIAHSWYEDVADGSSVCFLHMGECVAKELKEAKLRPLEAGSPLRIGVLATNTDLTAAFYQQKLQSEGFEVVVPDKATIEHTIIPAVEALTRKDIEGAQNLFRIALQVLLVRAVNTVIIASDDMCEVLPPDDPLLKKCIDPLDALARSTVKYALSAERCKEP
ncbi:PREDICTED: uncharacterized protein LOC109146948 [Ipomoea nil]|uniref:uncharacterized protein LOC109146948 n=1 Tax=Ipomoea nil TaxID=35883 RepID=UPI000900903D|nr:PREDICTED: uncharacterized protein LOC109146948 [Ipomoea nil]